VQKELNAPGISRSRPCGEADLVISLGIKCLSAQSSTPNWVLRRSHVYCRSLLYFICASIPTASQYS